MGRLNASFLFVILLVLAATPAFASLRQIPVTSRALCSQALLPQNDWYSWAAASAQERMFRNISAEGAARGSVIASPSTDNPNYFYHWIRDAALTMDVVVELWEKETDEGRAAALFQHIWDYLEFSRDNQLADTPTGLGEPKLEADGRPFIGPWGRPQNDGPALRAVTAIRVARHLLAAQREDLVSRYLYRAELPAMTLIKADLEYVAHNWDDPSFDLWEEVLGDHYYTRLTQWRAMRDGAELAQLMGDSGAAAFYSFQADAIAQSFDHFWVREANRLRATVRRMGGLDYKHSELDVAVVLAALHVGRPGERGGVDDDRLLATLPVLEDAFAETYPLNHATPDLPPAIGRYAEDRYYGGNPWILATAAMAEHAFRLRIAKAALPIVLYDVNYGFWSRVAPHLHLIPGSVVQPGSVEHEALMAALLARGDAYLERVRRHMPHDGRLDEQWDRHSGFQTSARDLTWSYASMITALSWRDAALTK